MTDLDEIETTWANGEPLSVAQVTTLFDQRRQLRSEVARLTERLGECTGCQDCPEEFCPQHGRTWSELLELIDATSGQCEELQRKLALIRQACQAEEIAHAHRQGRAAWDGRGVATAEPQVPVRLLRTLLESTKPTDAPARPGRERYIAGLREENPRLGQWAEAHFAAKDSPRDERNTDDV